MANSCTSEVDNLHSRRYVCLPHLQKNLPRENTKPNLIPLSIFSPSGNQKYLDCVNFLSSSCHHWPSLDKILKIMGITKGSKSSILGSFWSGLITSPCLIFKSGYGQDDSLCKIGKYLKN